MKKSAKRNATVLAAVIAVIAAILVYRAQDKIPWPKTFGDANDLAQMAALIVAAGWALNRFASTRANRTFLEIAVDAKVVGNDGERLLVEADVRLKNIGAARINARTGHDADGFVYNDRLDQCAHAGTLKIRAIQPGTSPGLFDWYGLPPLHATLTLAAPQESAARIRPGANTLEQINYLADFQDPTKKFTDVDFWLEPNEVYELTAPLWLPPGHYAFKAYFLGQERRHGEDEYWSHTVYRRLEALPPIHRPPAVDVTAAAGSRSGASRDLIARLWRILEK